MGELAVASITLGRLLGSCFLFSFGVVLLEYDGFLGVSSAGV